MSSKNIVAFGEIMLRLTPQASILNANEYKAVYGGTESNILVELSALGNSTRYLTKLPDNDLGLGAVMHLKRYGVDCSEVKLSGDNMGMYFLEKGFGVRPAKVIYSRKHAEITTLKENDFDFDKVFSDTALFHISGISFALSSSVRDLCFRLLEEAKKRNIPVSFDFNYRAKLWSIEEAAEVYKRIIPFANIVFCSGRDLEAFLNITKKDFFNVYKEAEWLVVREREILSENKHIIKTEAITKDGVAAVTEKQAHILERIGGGDAFAAGFIHGYLNFGSDIDRTLNFAADCFVIKATQEGDVLYMSEKEINALSLYSLKDVKR